MENAVPMVELWRGGMRESLHFGHAVVWDEGGVAQSWGDPATIIFPRSACKMIQALPLIESGAADAAGLDARCVALSCASHQGTKLHVGLARQWLASLDLAEQDLRCGSHEPYDAETRNDLIRAGESPCQFHNNCSGKHCGFLTVTRHLKAGPEYVETDHPLQRAIRQATEEVCGESVAAVGIDGCSAPNFATSLSGLARAMQAFAAATEGGSARERAMVRLSRSMAAHPDLVAGEGRASTGLMRAVGQTAVFKSGAEGVFVAILPAQKIGVAIKITDGNSRASEAVLVALLARMGLLDPAHPEAIRHLPNVQKNCRGLAVADLRLAEGFV